MLLHEEESKFLAEIGLTKTQAKVYLKLLKLVEADGKTLTKNTKIPRTEVYRMLDELHSKGLVEKEIATKPYKFRPTPLRLGLEILMTQKTQQFKEIERKTEMFLQKNSINLLETLPKQEYRITVIEGKPRILQVIGNQHDQVQHKVHIISTIERWLQIIDCCFENIKHSLERGVQYRVVLANSKNKINLSHASCDLITKPNFKLRFSKKPLQTNAAIFDGKEATFNFYPSKALKESPILWTNHPSFLSMFEDHFKITWKSAIPSERIMQETNLH